jgi:hypothetical protein
MAYVVFAILSGALMILVAAVATLSRSLDLTVGERASAFLFGAGLIIYGIWAGSADSGYFVFPAFVFVIPFLFVGYLLVQAWESWGSSKPAEQHPSAATAGPRAAAELPGSPVRGCSQCGAPPEAGDAWCTECGGRLHQTEPGPSRAGAQTGRCRHCGTSINGGSAFCTCCGQPVTQAFGAPTAPRVAAGIGARPRRCLACASELEIADVFCTQCGQSQAT